MPTVENSISCKEKDAVFYTVRENPFDLYGIYSANKDDCFRRMPEEAAKRVSDRTLKFHTNTTGARVRFCTDSPYVAFSIKLRCVAAYPQFMSALGVAGIDIYTNGRFSKAFAPINAEQMENGYEGIHYFHLGGKKEVQINLPLYSEVFELFIGVAKGSVLEHGAPYKNKKPVVFYGSSIVHGGNVSSPSGAYPAVVSQTLDCDFKNLGFSGSAFGERTMAEYISGLEMSCLVFDYDHNAPTVEHLAKTHEPFFEIFRKSNPTTPVIFITMPFSNNKEERKARCEVIKKTYDNARQKGDENVYFIDSREIFEPFDCDMATNDGTHPNDLGTALIARAVADKIKESGILN